MADREWFQVAGGRSVQAGGVEREFKKLVAKLRRCERERDAAEAEVERLRVAIVAHRLRVRTRDQEASVPVHAGTSAQSVNERLWAVLDTENVYG